MRVYLPTKNFCYGRRPIPQPRSIEMKMRRFLEQSAHFERNDEQSIDMNKRTLSILMEEYSQLFDAGAAPAFPLGNRNSPHKIM